MDTGRCTELSGRQIFIVRRSLTSLFFCYIQSFAKVPPAVAGTRQGPLQARTASARDPSPASVDWNGRLPAFGVADAWYYVNGAAYAHEIGPTAPGRRGSPRCVSPDTSLVSEPEPGRTGRTEPTGGGEREGQQPSHRRPVQHEPSCTADWIPARRGPDGSERIADSDWQQRHAAI